MKEDSPIKPKKQKMSKYMIYHGVLVVRVLDYLDQLALVQPAIWDWFPEEQKDPTVVEVTDLKPISKN